MNTRQALEKFNKWWRAVTELMPTGTIDNAPTQKDKPSPHAGITMRELRNRLRLAFPYNEGYRINGVANTNSMEPLFDANSLVVLERLNVNKYRERFLKISPFSAGDVVVYDYMGVRFIHMLREYNARRGGWLLQGNNNKLPDPFIIKEKYILYRMVAVGYTPKRRHND